MTRIFNVFALAVLVLVPLPIFAQGTFGSAGLAGVVRDTSGGVLPGVLVEATSPTLIERVRSAGTDGNGQFTITDLRPGTYTVTFTLSGFARYQREGLELEGSSFVTVNAELRVGAIQETVTVTGAKPVLDLQNTLRQTVLSKEIIDALPTSRLRYALGVLVPGVSSSNRDVGGAEGNVSATTLTIHGSRDFDQRFMQNGMNLGVITSAATSIIVPNTGAAREVVVETAAGSAERQTGGVVVNFIPQDGGNRLLGSIFVTGAGESQQANNLTRQLIDQGAAASPNRLQKMWDVNPGFGGPILRDRVWFYYTFRSLGSQIGTNMFHNRNEFVPGVWTYVGDPNRPALSRDAVWTDNQIRLTWQIDQQKNKVAFTASNQATASVPTSSAQPSHPRRPPTDVTPNSACCRRNGGRSCLANCSCRPSRSIGSATQWKGSRPSATAARST